MAKTYSEKMYIYYVKSGAFFAFIIAAMLGYIYISKPSGYANGNTMMLSACFSKNIDGIGKDSEVRFLGHQIGKVLKTYLNDNLKPCIKMEVLKKYNIPSDSNIEIHTDGYVGDKYLEIIPGFGLEYMEDGEEFEYTQDAVIVEDILTQYLQSTKEGE
jgi:phospholipid/cholesterol/gamma-HCH transport system substrate-binding protein